MRGHAAADDELAAVVAQHAGEGGEIAAGAR